MLFLVQQAHLTYPNTQKIVYLPTFVDAFRGYQGVGHHAFATRVHKQPMFLQNFMIPF